MKRFSALLIIAVFFATLISFGMAEAGDKIIDTTLARDVVTKLDKNGQEYSRAVVKEQRQLHGVTYDKEILIMAFGANSDSLKGMMEGDTLKAVVSTRSYNGNTTYQLQSKIE